METTMTNTNDMREAFGDLARELAEARAESVEPVEQSQQAQGQELRYCEHCSEMVPLKCADPSGNMEIGFCGKAPAAVPEKAKQVLLQQQNAILAVIQDCATGEASLDADRYRQINLAAHEFEKHHDAIFCSTPPAPAAVPEFDKKLFDSECRESVAGALGFQRGGDYAWSYLLAQIKEAVAAAAMLTASPAPEHSGDGNEMVAALRQYRHNDGGGFVFAYDKEQTDRIVTGLVKALEKIEAYEIKSSPTATDFGVSFDRAICIGGMKEMARNALAECRKQGGEV